MLFYHTLCDTGELRHLALSCFWPHLPFSHFILSSTLVLLVLVLSFCLCYPAVSYPPSYKKTPPPVPPRTTTKPLISVTAQSSTESTQDAYQEGRHPRGGLWTTDSLGRPIYSSMDSLDSTKAVTMAMESAAGKRHASLGSHISVQTCDKAVLVSKAEEYLKTPRSSIGIQVATIFFTSPVFFSLVMEKRIISFVLYFNIVHMYKCCLIMCVQAERKTFLVVINYYKLTSKLR